MSKKAEISNPKKAEVESSRQLYEVQWSKTAKKDTVYGRCYVVATSVADAAAKLNPTKGTEVTSVHRMSDSSTPLVE